MSLLSKRTKLLILGAALIVALPIVAVSANNQWSKYHLERTSDQPVVVGLGDNVDNGWGGFLLDSAADWHVAPELNVSVVGGQSPSCDPATGDIEVCNATYGDTGWLGIAGIWVKRGKNAHITKGYVKVNDTYFNSPPYNTSEWKQMVMCQEIGHTLGLSHQDENFGNGNLGTCMDYTSLPGVEGDADNNLHPNDHDYAQLAEMYAHNHGDSDGGDSGGGGGGGKCGKGPHPACASSFGIGTALEHGIPAGVGPADGDVFITDMGRGVSLVTFVTWVQ